MSPRVAPRVAGVFGAVLTMLVGVAGAGFVAPAAAVTTDQSYWIPAGDQITVHGRGFGHGHGMSQYGAQGAALQGRSYREIMDFYYPGTAWAKMRGRVRVLITSDTTSDVTVSPARGLRVRDLGTGKVYFLPDKAGVQRWRLHVVRGETVVAFFTRRWHRYEPGGAKTLVGDGEFQAREPLTLWTSSGQSRYRGRLRSASPYRGADYRDTVNVLSMNKYLQGVVPYEMPASWHPEAVKAQSVAARTYATWSRNQNRGRYYQICDTTACQVYGGADAEDSRSNAAVHATSREILTFHGDPAFTQFSASSGGWTSAGSTPYLVAKRDPFDGWSGNYVHDWSVTVDAGHFERAYPQLGNLRRIRVLSRDGHGQWRGRVNSIELDGSRSDVTISGDDFRWAFGLRSNWFTIERTPIISRWSRIGGAKSRIGGVRSPEYRSGRGVAQRFAKGRIYYSRSTGANELYGPILRRYRGGGGPSSILRFPMTPVRKLHWGDWARFQRGSIFWHRKTGAVALERRISRRFLWYGGVDSALGWPVRGNYEIRRGERAEFQHGSILWFQDTGRLRVRLDRRG